MIEEDYVSFETAKLLKEKGFDEDCLMMFFVSDISEDLINTKTYKGTHTIRNSQLNDYSRLLLVEPRNCTAPTLQMAMKWLRDTFHLEIYPFHDAIQENNDWWYRIERHSRGCGLTEHESDVIYKTYEDACEAGIKYCLEKLI